LDRGAQRARLALLGVCCAVVACEPSKQGCPGVGATYARDERGYVDPPVPVETSDEDRPLLITDVELRNASARTVWLGRRWFIVPSQLERGWMRDEIESITAELGCVCWCDSVADEWPPVCTRALCPSADAEGATPPESYAPFAPNEERSLQWSGDLTYLDTVAKCRYSIGYPEGTQITAALCWYDADPNETPSAGQHCVPQVFAYGDATLSLVIADAASPDADEDGSVGDDDGGTTSSGAR
jgi:hypothetical protein